MVRKLFNRCFWKSSGKTNTNFIYFNVY